MPVPAALKHATRLDRDSDLLLGRRALVRSLLWLAVVALAIVWLGRYTDVDLMLADRAFDAGSSTFPWRHAWLAETFSHGILKMALTAAGVLVVLAAAVDLVRPRTTPSRRLRLQIVALSAILVPLVTSTLKRESIAHCPWDLERYGGTVRSLDIACRAGMHRRRCGCSRSPCSGCRTRRARRWPSPPPRRPSGSQSAGCSSCAAPIF
jgi:membrane-associated PAP2 superfamily phosphatase